MSEHTPYTQPGRSPAGRAAAFAVGGVVGVIAVVFLAIGSLLFWADSQKDDQGYLSTGSDRYATTTHAMATENLDLDVVDGDWLVDQDRFGKVRLRVTPNADKPLFVGIAPSDKVESYLAGTSHATVTDVDYSPFHADYREEPGSGGPAVPAEQGFWAASAHGAGTQTLTWEVEEGDWSVVVMNEDGSRGVDAGVSAGANVPIIGDLAWVSTGTGLVLLTGAAALFVIGIRTRPRHPGDAARPAAAVTA